MSIEMSQVKNFRLTAEQRAVVLDLAWRDKKGRSDEVSPLTLFIAIDRPRPDLGSITDLVLATLSEDVHTSHLWSRSWGRVVVCVQPGGKSGVALGDSSEPKFKSFVPVSSTAIVVPSELVAGKNEAGVGTIVLNDRPMTIEAFLISYIHMLDELILDLSRRRVDLDGFGSGAKKYARILYRIKTEGFEVKTAPEEEILLLKAADPAVSVRLYGSGVNKSVPRVMGAAIIRKNV